MRRVPIQSVVGENAEETNYLRLLFCLGEIERQAEIFNRSLASAVSTALDRDDVDEVWQHIQSALFAAIIVRRFLAYGEPHAFPGAGSKAQRKQRAQKALNWRVAELRNSLEIFDDIKDNPLFKVKGIRNSLEHIEERIDAAFANSGTQCISDWYLADGVFLSSLEEVAKRSGSAGGMRGFDPESGFLMFDREPFNLFALDIEMLKMRHNAREAQVELMKKRRGRPMLGNLQLIRSRNPKGPQLIDKWRSQRAEIEAAMCPRPRLEGVRIWAEAQEPGGEKFPGWKLTYSESPDEELSGTQSTWTTQISPAIDMSASVTVTEVANAPPA